MKATKQADFAERLKTASEAKKALLAKFTPKPAAPDPQFTLRADRQAEELARVRQARAEAKAAKQQAALEAAEAARLAEEALAADAMDAKRGERKERKALSKAEAKAKRDARYAARKARH